jgi:hypothetical protein
MEYADGTYIKFGDILVKLDVPIGYWVGTVGFDTLDNVADGTIVGVWTKDGKTYYDKSVWVASRAKAISLGMSCNQMAIWDNEGQTEIWLNFMSQVNSKIGLQEKG